MGRKYFEDSHNGYRFRYPDDWEVVPVQENQRDIGLVAKLQGEGKLVNTDTNEMFRFYPNLFVFSLKYAAEEDEPSGGRTRSREDISDVIPRLLRVVGFKPDEPTEDDEVKVKGVVARHRMWEVHNGYVPLILDTWSYPLGDREICLVFRCLTEKQRKYTSVYKKCAKTFEPIEVVRAIEQADRSDYEGMLAYHRDLASRAEGWRVLPTPSKRFIIKTSSDDEDFIEEVIERLERSRDLFEEDFPPPDTFDEVSVVRICRDGEEFHRYGGTGGGTAGWFSPLTTELVLFDYREIDRRMTFAVMTHEAFHQYCFYLFDQSEAHRWFDEGHGDYYGAADFKRRGKVEIERKMPGGLDRYTIIKQMMNSDSWEPIEDHIQFNHREWQSRGVPSYSQSWSIIYMLRQGARGELKRKKYWKDEYAHIIPSYVRTLNDGFLAAYEEILKEREKEAEAEDRELTEEERDINRFDLKLKQKNAIWKEAIEASWGKVDIAQFQEDWIDFVDDL